jgi:large conductance mechanosensitive channel
MNTLQKQLKAFVQFIREQGIVGIAIAFILGGAITKLVASLVADIIQPIIGLVFGSTDGLAALEYKSITYGNFLVTLIDFLIVAAVVYWLFKALRLDKFDKKKD